MASVTIDEIKDFLPTDLITVLATTHPLDSDNSYFDRNTRSKREAAEATLEYDMRLIEEADLGNLYEASVKIQLFKALPSPYWNQDFRENLEKAAQDVVDAYHNKIDTFQAQITGDVDYVLCTEDGPPVYKMRNNKDGGRTWIFKELTLVVGVWES